MSIRTLLSLSFALAITVCLSLGCSRHPDNELANLPETAEGEPTSSQTTGEDPTIPTPISNDSDKNDDKSKSAKAKKTNEAETNPDVNKFFEIKDMTIVNAEQYLHALDNEPGTFGFHKFELPDAEIDKVVKELRSRYAFESIRQRLSYEDPTERTAHQETTLPDLYSNLGFRRQALAKLHSNEVKAFVSRPMNGFSRVVRPSPEMLKFPTPPPMTPDRFTFHPGPAERKDKVTNHLHKSFEFGFAGHSAATALVKSLDEVAGFKPHGIALNLEAMDSPKSLPTHVPDKEYMEAIRADKEKGDVAWKLNRFQLVSLLKHQKPRVYVSENIPGMAELSDESIETRELNEFETFALERLRDGEDVILKEHETRIEMMGSLRAQKQCLECHSVKEKSLLGTFSYEFRVIKGLKQNLEKSDDSKGT